MPTNQEIVDAIMQGKVIQDAAGSPHVWVGDRMMRLYVYENKNNPGGIPPVVDPRAMEFKVAGTPFESPRPVEEPPVPKLPRRPAQRSIWELGCTRRPFWSPRMLRKFATWLEQVDWPEGDARLMTAREIGDRLGMSPSGLLRWIQEGVGPEPQPRRSNLEQVLVSVGSLKRWTRQVREWADTGKLPKKNKV